MSLLPVELAGATRRVADIGADESASFLVKGLGYAGEDLIEIVRNKIAEQNCQHQDGCHNAGQLSDSLACLGLGAPPLEHYTALFLATGLDCKRGPKGNASKGFLSVPRLRLKFTFYFNRCGEGGLWPHGASSCFKMGKNREGK